MRFLFWLTEIQVEQGKPARAQPSGSRRRSSTAGTSYSTVSERETPPPERRPQAQNRHLIVLQNPGHHNKGGRRGTPGGHGGKGGGARPSPVPKAPRDPNAPKRPTNPFLRFCEQERDNVRGLHGHDENFDLTKAMGIAWRELDEKAKQPFKNAFNEDQKRYKDDMLVYEQMKKQSERRPAGIGGHRPHTSSSRVEESASYYDDDEALGEEASEEVEEGVEGSVLGANLVGREGSVDAMDLGEIASNADVGTPAGSTPGPSAASGFTAVNRRSGPLDAGMFKQED